MKKTIIGITLLILMSLGLMVCCTKETVNPFGGEKGQVTFWTETDIGVGNITIYIEGNSVGTMSRYFSGGVNCGGGDVNAERDAGTYNWNATSQGGATWSGSVTFIKGECNTLELRSGGGSSGGGGTCNYTTYSGTNNCSSSGQIAVTNTLCCPTTSPYYCSSTNGCYSSCASAKTACGSTGVILGQNGSGGGSSCASMNSSLTVTQVAGCSSGTTDLKIKNNSSVQLYVKVCFLRVDTGNWDCYVDLAVSPGSTSTWGLVSCSAKWTQYSICSMKSSDWTGGCSSPVCHP